ncbi:ead/Ea22-like family protein [Enterobacter hormaechei subsp. hormaechei]|uniref:ead/Ea22-like family protein n=1 Tax=Enterobacter hormaechei TaxID=158836 RepID=UPI003D6F1FE5|nr:ead/Ea22-like family protein [Enterobacter hormaechei subsp. hormaechei]
MSNIDKQTLRQLAVDAKELAIIKRYTKGIEAHKKFIAVMTPATVLALLDELEGEAVRIKELESQRALAFMACNRWRDKCVEAEQKLEAAEMRIAELEAREVRDA